MSISQQAQTLIGKANSLAKENTNYNAARTIAALSNPDLNAESLATFLEMGSYKESMVVHRLNYLIWDLKEKSSFGKEDLLFSIDIPNEALLSLRKEYYTNYNGVIVFANIALINSDDSWQAFRVKSNVRDGIYLYGKFSHSYEYYKGDDRLPPIVRRMITDYAGMSRDYWRK
jgi:hypothetical protein